MKIEAIFLITTFTLFGLGLFTKTDAPQMKTHEVNIDSLFGIRSFAPKPVMYKSHKLNASKFYDKLGYLESRNNYKITNSLGYLGKYQFHIRTLKGLGFDTTPTDYLNDPDMQEKSVRAYVKFNKKVLKKYIAKYKNEFLMIGNDSIFITESGLCAAAHLGGAGNVMKLFTEGTVFKDGNGVPITRYLKTFENYDI